MTPKLLVIPGSTRIGSVNDKLANLFVSELNEHDLVAEKISLNDYPLPVLDTDIDVPQEAIDLANRFAEVDGLVFVSPEYNASITPLLKNAIDWVSISGVGKGNGYGPYVDKVCLLAAASPGEIGGLRGLYHLRAVLMNVGAEIITPQVCVGRAEEAFDENGQLRNERLQGFMKTALSELVIAIKRVKAITRS